ncbi:hypothetical protein F5Y11DRAFT_311662 [Daldinia sp. FL1419]|nr:hypothetical protein F5Y11DRAFT_311662 [Daldinia sp. FL1419]
MGLAGPRTRRKLQHDPNNTKWSRDETTFGQKILRAQGWEPGKFLGAQNASHSHLHTAASAAPINVLLKDDTLGLGAKPRHKQNTECTGLDVFKDLLGRLNGKSEETIEKERKVKSEIKTCLYVERKYGPMRFVSGGLLVGDQMEGLTTKAETPEERIKEEDIKEEDIKEESVTSSDGISDRPAKKQKKEKKSKKRKAGDTDPADESDAIPEKKRKKRSKNEASRDDSADSVETEDAGKKKKSKKSKRKDTEESDSLESEKKKKKKSKKDAQREVEDEDISMLSEEPRVEKSKSKKDKKEKKEKHKKDKKDKKDKKQKQSDTSNSSTDASVSTSASTPALGTTPQESGASTPSGTGASTPQPFSIRNYSRSRHIASKRMAIADMQAMNQIFMVKPV